MQQNMLRWFYQAYVNRLGMHLIELLSGRLAIGADAIPPADTPAACRACRPVSSTSYEPLSIVVAGTAGSGKSRLIAMIQRSLSRER